jgi:hypothetical protein
MMKHLKFFCAISLFVTAFLYVQYAEAMSVAAQPAKLNITIEIDRASDDDDREDTDEVGDQCLLLFPFCEAHIA